MCLINIFMINPLQYKKVDVPNGTLIKVKSVTDKSGTYETIEFMIDNIKYKGACYSMIAQEICKKLPENRSIKLENSEFYAFASTQNSTNRGVFTKATFNMNNTQFINYVPSQEKIDNIINFNKNERFVIYSLLYAFILFLIFTFKYVNKNKHKYKQ